MRENERGVVAALTILRVGAALLFLQHALQKLFGLLGGLNGHGATAPFPSLLGFAGPIELVGGVLLLLGLLTRPAAVILASEMLVAYVTQHAPHGPWPLRNRGELALLYLLIWLYLAVRGAGPISLDRLISRRRGTR